MFYLMLRVARTKTYKEFLYKNQDILTIEIENIIYIISTSHKKNVYVKGT